MNKILIILLVGLLLNITTVNAEVLGSEFTYQGELKDNLDNLLTGTYDFQFVAYDGDDINTATILATFPTVGVQVVQVINGVFTTQIDFGDMIFSGDKVWMQIQVGITTGGLTTLSPLQPITAAPYAVHAQFVGAGVVGEPQINASEVQLRVSNACPSGSSIRVINENGSVDCELDDDTQPVASPSRAFLGRSTNTSSGKFNFAGKTGTAAAYAMCQSNFGVNSPSAHMCTPDDIDRILQLDNTPANIISVINNVQTWSIFHNYQGLASNRTTDNTCFGLSANDGDLERGVTVSVNFNQMPDPNGILVDHANYQSGIACGNFYPVLCCSGP